MIKICVAMEICLPPDCIFNKKEVGSTKKKIYFKKRNKTGRIPKFLENFPNRSPGLSGNLSKMISVSSKLK